MRFGYQDNLTVAQLYGFLGRESDCVIVGNHCTSRLEVDREPPHAT